MYFVLFISDSFFLCISPQTHIFLSSQLPPLPPLPSSLSFNDELPVPVSIRPRKDKQTNNEKQKRDEGGSDHHTDTDDSDDSDDTEDTEDTERVHLSNYTEDSESD